MPSIFAYWTLALCLVYLLFMLSQRKYRLLLPSTLHSITWSATALIMIFQINGTFISSKVNENVFNLSAEFMCYIVVASIIGFIAAHIITSNHNTTVTPINHTIIDNILKKFKWIPFLCAITGILLFISLVSIMGSIENFSDYRSIAVTYRQTGYFAIVKRISGHVNILGSFYLMLLGYKMGQQGLNLKIFLYYALMCSLINMSTGGRVWILTSTLPFLVTFLFSRHYSPLNQNILKSDKKKIFIIITLFISLFSIIGILRTESGSRAFMDKFQYFTDGMRITNIVLEQYPIGSYDLEYGRSEFLSLWIGSPMADRFNESISDNIGLLVTVKSSLPFLYYDYGFIGGVFMWGIFCFIIEYFCLRLKHTNTIIGILLFGQLAQIFFQAPIFPIFSLNTPFLEWILLLFILRKYIFGNIKGCKQYI